MPKLDSKMVPRSTGRGNLTGSFLYHFGFVGKSLGGSGEVLGDPWRVMRGSDKFLGRPEGGAGTYFWVYGRSWGLLGRPGGSEQGVLGAAGGVLV